MKVDTSTHQQSLSINRLEVVHLREEAKEMADFCVRRSFIILRAHLHCCVLLFSFWNAHVTQMFEEDLWVFGQETNKDGSVVVRLEEEFESRAGSDLHGKTVLVFCYTQKQKYQKKESFWSMYKS